MASRVQREKHICNINDVTPGKRNWKVLIQVLQKKKGGVSKSPTNPTQYRGYLFVDTVGTILSAVTFGSDVAYFESSLLPYRRYYISNAYVKLVKAGFEVSDCKFSWTLYSTTEVHPLEETVPPPIPYDFQFKRVSELFKYADRDTPINVTGFVIKAFPEMKVGVDKIGRDMIAKDFIIINSENTPMKMRLWNEKLEEYADVLSDGLPEGIFFLAMNVKVTTFNCLSLSSRPGSAFLRDPLIPDALELKKWYAANKKDVDHLVIDMAYKDTARLLQKPSPADILSVRNAMGTLETIKTAWISGKLHLVPGQEKFWFMACKNCQKAFKSNHKPEEPCPKCGESSPVSYKCHIAATITDKTETTIAEIYSPDVELLTPFTVDKFRAAEEEGRSVVTELEAALENKHVVGFVKYFDKLFRGEVTRKFPLTKIYHYEDVFHVKDAVLEESQLNDPASSKIQNEEAIDLTNDDDHIQFFTPSMKQRIDQISAAIEIDPTDLGTPSTCKKVLAFGDLKQPTATVKIEPLDDDVALQSSMNASSSVESPVKKMKPTSGQE